LYEGLGRWLGTDHDVASGIDAPPLHYEDPADEVVVRDRAPVVERSLIVTEPRGVVAAQLRVPVAVVVREDQLLHWRLASDLVVHAARHPELSTEPVVEGDVAVDDVVVERRLVGAEYVDAVTELIEDDVVHDSLRSGTVLTVDP